VAEIYTIHNAMDWQLDASAAIDLEARLRPYGFAHHGISMEVHVQARETRSLFEALLKRHTVSTPNAAERDEQSSPKLQTSARN
jgi:hypothetical protein